MGHPTDKNSLFWALGHQEIFASLNSSEKGLTEAEAKGRIGRYGFNEIGAKKKRHGFDVFVAQFKSPIILILIFAAILSFFLHDAADGTIILAIIFISSLLGFWQEYGASNAVSKLLEMVRINAQAMRDGELAQIPLREIVPGDVVVLNAGGTVPGDCLLLESKDLFVNEATLTGETFPVEKREGVLPGETPLAKRTNALFMGTHVVSGSARAIVVSTAFRTEFGSISQRLQLRSPETEFERGIRRFGYFLMEVTSVLVFAIFAINVFMTRPVLDSFLFALAIAVGLTPQLLPAIISVNLASGARRMANQKVIVKRLASIENFGSMNVLCSDKTGTLTEGVVHFHSALDIEGKESEEVFRYAYINASFETGFANPIDEAIRSHHKMDITGYQKKDEVPYDFIRKRLSILVEKDKTHLMLTKGAFQNIVDVCSSARTSKETIVDIEDVRGPIKQRFEDLSNGGYRTLGLACRQVGNHSSISKDDEKEMTFFGFLAFFDPPKEDIIESIARLKGLGVTLKIITGDNRFVAANVSQQIGLSNSRVATGAEIRQMSDEALNHHVNNVDVFAEVDPNQKERIILALKKAGHVVGYMGDGINDASALHAADVGISVDTAVDVAKEAADIILLERGLRVLADGVSEGRKTFANTLKYVYMATSANFGNMFSMAGASFFMPFLPLLPKQILLVNLMTDFPEMTIATDSVDKELVEKPQRWNINKIRKFMFVFGPLSSAFDFLTFGALFFILHSSTAEFRTGWFIESVVSASLVVLIFRSRRPFFKSQPGKYLSLANGLVITAVLVIPFTPLGAIFGFVKLPVLFYPVLGIILLLYIVSAEIAKKQFYKGSN